MTRLEALQALAEKVEAGDEKWVHLPRTSDLHTDLVWKAWSGSLDAAKALHEAVLPGLKVRLIDSGTEYDDVGRWNAKINWEHITWQSTFTARGPFGYEGQSNCPARAWLLAILRALIATEQDKGDE